MPLSGLPGIGFGGVGGVTGVGAGYGIGSIGQSFYPGQLPGNAAWYDLSGTASSRTYLTDASSPPKISLIADRSGNSAVNCLVLNGVTGNYAGSPSSSAINITGDIDIRISARLPVWGTGSNQLFLARRNGTGAYWLVMQSNGKLGLNWNDSGGTGFTDTSTATVSSVLGAYVAGWVRATLQVNNGAGGHTSTFYTSTDGVNWTILGSAVVTGGTTSIKSTSDPLEIGSQIGGASVLNGIIYQALIYSTIGSATNTGAIGSGAGLAFWANFNTASKILANGGTFNESANNAVVTLNSTGATGARICGERDLVQLTAANEPLLLSYSGTKYGYTGGVTGTGFGAPSNSSMNVGANFCLVWDGVMATWSPAGETALIGKWSSTDTKRQYLLTVQSGGILEVFVSDNGSGSTHLTSLASSVGTGFSALTRNAVRVDYVGGTAAATFYTAPTAAGPWTQLGTVPTGTARTPYQGTGGLTVNCYDPTNAEVVNGYCYEASVYNGTYSPGNLVSDFNPNASYSTGATWTASTGEVWTINGGACVVTGNAAYFNGTSHYMASAPFSLAHPETVYQAVSQPTWTAARIFTSGGSANNMQTYQTGTTPGVKLYSSGSDTGPVTPPLQTQVVLCSLYNVASSAIAYNRNNAVTGTTGTAGDGNGFAVGGAANGSGLANITASELLVRSAADSTTTQLQITNYLISKWGITP